MHFSNLSTAALAAVAFAISSSAHSWIEEMRIIAPNGTFTTDAPGYARSNAKRLPGVDPDKAMVHILPPDGTPVEKGITPDDVMCMPSQQKQTQSSDSPRLEAAPGDMVALRYQENGHVTLPDINPAKPPNRGTVYIYGTTQPSDDEKFLAVHKSWNADGTGGNKKGKLLATQNFDDGQCYQINGGQISATRQKQFPHKADPLMGQDLWCQNDLVIPKDAINGKPYTLYWVWDWSDRPGVDPSLPKGKAQFYTTCADVTVTASKDSNANSKAIKFAQGQSLDEAAIPAYVSKLASGDAMLATPSQTAGAAPGAASSAPMSPSSSAPATNQQPQAASTPQAGAAAATTIYRTVTVSQAQTTASAEPNSAPQGIPTISLKSFSGTAVPAASAAGNAGGYKMVKRGQLHGHVKARPTRSFGNSARFRI